MWVASPSVCTPSQVRERAAGGPSRDVTLDSANVRSRTDPPARSDRPLMAGTARSQSTPIAVADQPSDRCRRTAAGLGLELSVPATSGSCATEPIADIECCLPPRGVGCGCAAVLAHQARRAMFAEPRDARSNDPPAAVCTCLCRSPGFNRPAHRAVLVAGVGQAADPGRRVRRSPACPGSCSGALGARGPHPRRAPWHRPPRRPA